MVALSHCVRDRLVQIRSSTFIETAGVPRKVDGLLHLTVLMCEGTSPFVIRLALLIKQLLMHAIRLFLSASPRVNPDGARKTLCNDSSNSADLRSSKDDLASRCTGSASSQVESSCSHGRQLSDYLLAEIKDITDKPI
jgi:hypothetical protein